MFYHTCNLIIMPFYFYKLYQRIIKQYLYMYINIWNTLEKNLNVEGFLEEKSLKIKSDLKSTGKLLLGFQKYLNFAIFVGINTVN